MSTGETRVRWWNRLAAHLCERWLHDLALPAWNEAAAGDDERGWEDARREQEMIRDILAEGYSDGWDDAEREFRHG